MKKTLIMLLFCSQLASSIARFEWNWWPDWHECHLLSILLFLTLGDSFMVGKVGGWS